MPITQKLVASKSASNKAYIFFNCDGEKSLASKNITYNKAVYGAAKTSRNALWKKIQEERANHRIIIDECNLELVKKIILEKNPKDASQYMQFGDIMELDKF